MSTTETRRHVLVWVTKEFLESEGMPHIPQESGAVPGQEKDWEKIVSRRVKTRAALRWRGNWWTSITARAF